MDLWLCNIAKVTLTMQSAIVAVDMERYLPAVHSAAGIAAVLRLRRLLLFYDYSDCRCIVVQWAQL